MVRTNNLFPASSKAPPAMLAPVSDAIQRFRRRLQLAAFVRGMSVSCFAALSLVVVALLAERFGEVQLLSDLPGWVVWTGVAAVALVGGALIAHRTAFADQVVVQHLEQRLLTNGLLLAASQGVTLDPAFERRLLKQLAAASAVLPVVRWQHLAMRPIAVALLVLIAQQLPAKIEQRQASEALNVAIDRLAKEVEEIAQLDAVPDGHVEELRKAVTDLSQRAETGDYGLWREIDQLQERLDREEKLAAGDDGGAGKLGPKNDDGKGDANPESASAGASNETRQPIDGTRLADAMSKLGKLKAGTLDNLMARLPGDLGDAEKKAIADAIKPDGSVDPVALPDDKATQSALADAIAETVEELMADPAALAELMSGMSDQQQEGMAEELAALAKQFDRVGDPIGEEPAALAEAQLSKELSEELATAAAEMAKAGALDKLPEGLRDAIAEAGLSALENMDIQKLMSMLPDDLSQLTVMAENFAKLAESMQGSGEEGSSQEGQGGGGDPQPSKELQAKMASLAKGIMEKMGRAELGKLAKMANQANQANQGNQGNQANQGNQGRQGQPGKPGQQGDGQNGPAGLPGPIGTDGGGHAALKLTEDTQGGAADTDMQLPGRDPDDLPKEWVPVTIDKAEPKVGKTQTPGAGRAGAAGSGGATWQLRLMPRHREVVRRFFAEKK